MRWNFEVDALDVHRGLYIYCLRCFSSYPIAHILAVGREEEMRTFVHAGGMRICLRWDGVGRIDG